jgi:hypothetical protein
MRNVAPLNEAPRIDTQSRPWKGAGTIVLNSSGRRYTGDVAFIVNRDTLFTFDIYGPHAQSVVSISSGRDSAVLEFDGHVWQVSVSDSVSAIPIFSKYPFIFFEVKRILTGCLPEEEFISHSPHSTIHRGGKIRLFWERREMRVSVLIARRRGMLSRITYQGTGTHPWRLTMSRFYRGMSKQIYFQADENNYFTITFDTIILGESEFGQHDPQ